MQFVDFEKGCEPTALVVKTQGSLSTPQGKVKVKVNSFGINRADTLQRQGHYPPPPGESPILGLEVAGTVYEVGEGVSTFKQGDRVFGLVAGGGYATEVVVILLILFPFPKICLFMKPLGLLKYS